jgi:60 kDa SS-A/Ro ribonucleoprotein
MRSPQNQLVPVDNWMKLERFLILGSEAGTYHVTEQPLTTENAIAVQDCLKQDGLRVVKATIDASSSGRAPKNDPALFVLALSASPQFADSKTNSAALAALPAVARTAAHLSTYAAFISELRGWGRGLRSAIGNWYANHPVKELAYQLVKNKNRNGWPHRDLLRMAHPQPETAAHGALFQWAVKGELPSAAAQHQELRQLDAFERAKKVADEGELIRLIETYGLTQEMIPSEWKNSPRVWEALLDSMPYTTLVRNLGELTGVGVLGQLSDVTALTVLRLTDRQRIARSGIHPVALLSALLAYKQGRGARLAARAGSAWTPLASVVDALEEAFYVSFDGIEPSGKRIYLALDASRSMQETNVSGTPHLTAAMASAAMGMVIARTEPDGMIAAFDERCWYVDITKRTTLDGASAAIEREHGWADASLPIMDALSRQLTVDAFVILTDNKTWAGDEHPLRALQVYRAATGIAAKLVVVAMAAKHLPITGSNDTLQMDVAGFDASVPGVIADFIRQ